MSARDRASAQARAQNARVAARQALHARLDELLGDHWRLWAPLPAGAVIVLRLPRPRGRGLADAVTLRRPKFPRGVCRSCGCTEFDPCGEGCAWENKAQTQCTPCDVRDGGA